MIDHLDETLQGRATASLEDIIGSDPEADKEWGYLNLAVDAIKDAGLVQQVAAARAAWKAEIEAAAGDPTNSNVNGASTTTDSVETPANHTAALRSIPATAAKSGTVRTLYRYTLRAAACVILIVAGSAIYDYVTVSSTSLYNRYYGGYVLGTSRGAANADPIVEAYNAKDWATVQHLAGTAATHTNQTDFLAGMACLELKQYDEAIGHFEQVIAVNTHNGTDYYQDESEYYLAISWLARNQVNEAMPLLEKIKADSHHKFHEKVAKMSFFDLRLAQYKENK